MKGKPRNMKQAENWRTFGGTWARKMTMVTECEGRGFRRFAIRHGI
jgi:hypothetical protein